MVDQRQALAYYALLEDGLRRAQAEQASSLLISRPLPANARCGEDETLTFTADFLAVGNQVTLELFHLDDGEAGALLQAVRALQGNRRAERIEVCLRHAVGSTVELVTDGLLRSGFQRAAAPGRWEWQAPGPFYPGFPIVTP